MINGKNALVTVTVDLGCPYPAIPSHERAQETKQQEPGHQRRNQREELTPRKGVHQAEQQ